MKRGRHGDWDFPYESLVRPRRSTRQAAATSSLRPGGRPGGDVPRGVGGRRRPRRPADRAGAALLDAHRAVPAHPAAGRRGRLARPGSASGTSPARARERWPCAPLDLRGCGLLPRGWRAHRGRPLPSPTGRRAPVSRDRAGETGFSGPRAAASGWTARLRTGAGTRLAVIDDEAADVEQVELDRVVLVGVDAAPATTGHAALMMGWAVGAAPPERPALPRRRARRVRPRSTASRSRGSTSSRCRWRSRGPCSTARTSSSARRTSRAARAPCSTTPSRSRRASGDGGRGDRGRVSDRSRDVERGDIGAREPVARARRPRRAIRASIASRPAGGRAGGFCGGPQGQLRPFANRGPAVRWLAPGDDVAYPFSSRDRLFHAESSGASAIAAGVMLLLLGATAGSDRHEVHAILARTIDAPDARRRLRAPRSPIRSTSCPSVTTPTATTPSAATAAQRGARLRLRARIRSRWSWSRWARTLLAAVAWAAARALPTPGAWRAGRSAGSSRGRTWSTRSAPSCATPGSWRPSRHGPAAHGPGARSPPGRPSSSASSAHAAARHGARRAAGRHRGAAARPDRTARRRGDTRRVHAALCRVMRMEAPVGAGRFGFHRGGPVISSG